MGVVYPFPETDEVIYMKRAAEKLKSSRGASLMLALLAFLICAVLGSVVLTAGTASAGRFAELGEMEQRYYAVTSAAELLRDKLCDTSGSAITWSRTTVKTTVTPFTLDADGNMTLGTPATTTNNPTYNPDPLPVAATLSGMLAEYYLFSGATTNDARWASLTRDYSTPLPSPPSIPNMTLTVSTDTDGDLTVNIEPTLNPDGSLTLKINNEKNKANYQYTLKMTLTPAPEIEKLPLAETTTFATGTNQITETVTTTETVNATVRWVVSTTQIEEGTPPSPTSTP